MMTNKKIILKKLNELQTIWHPESGLVFKSREEKIVTGMYVDNEFIQLDNEAISICETWGFKFDETLLVPADDETDNEQPCDNDQPDDETDNDQPDDETDNEQPDDETDNEQLCDNSNDVSTTEISYVSKPDLLGDLESIKNKLESYITDNTKTVNQLTVERDNAKNSHDVLVSENNVLKIELDKLQTKFKALKGLFE